ncbi:carbohydrate kinase [soil metagenome]
MPVAPHTPSIACFGEVLWDCLPKGLFLGGAPLNVAFHLARLGCRSAVVSAVGDDFLGQEARRRIRLAGIDDSALATVPNHFTGTVLAELDSERNASYTFPDDVAWDAIAATPENAAVLGRADAIVYGSLAMRGAPNRQFFHDHIRDAPGRKLIDVNLRPPFCDPDAILQLARVADVVKLNEDELAILSGASDSAPLDEACAALRKRLPADPVLCITLGGSGAALSLPGREIIRASVPPVKVADTVGAGDSFMAALTTRILATDQPGEDDLRFACAVGAFVASKSGAMPYYTPDQIP